MSRDHVDPSIDLVSFSCPRCGALAHQTWYQTYSDELEATPYFPNAESLKKYLQDPAVTSERKVQMIEYLARIDSGEVLADESRKDLYRSSVFQNLYISRCYSCAGYAVWIHKQVVYPATQSSGFFPNPDLNSDIQRDFNEAGAILSLSPRGAAALLRLCIQKLCIQLGQPGKHLDTDIAALVTSGLDVHIQQALDIVRVVGNNAVHPGALDLRDDRATAASLFELVNLIADSQITQPARVKAIYDKVVPRNTQAAIKKRDRQP